MFPYIHGENRAWSIACLGSLGANATSAPPQPADPISLPGLRSHSHWRPSTYSGTTI